MKHYLIRCSLILCFLLVAATPVHAEKSYSHLYISISDALINTKQDEEKKVEEALHQFSEDWSSFTTEHKEAKEQVEASLQEAQKATTKEERLKALTTLSNSLRALEKIENPVDEGAQRLAFGKNFAPTLQTFEAALATGNQEEIEEAYKALTAQWTKVERPVREQSIAMYGQIETQMAFIRITLASEKPDVAMIQAQFTELQQTVADFVAGNDTAQVSEEGYSLATLIEFIDEATRLVDEKNYVEASNQIKAFITVWPNVEVEISTRNGSLYTKIENDMPIIVSDLLKSQVNEENVRNQLTTFRTEIGLLQGNTDYTLWDSALILLREGLEALLIILALVSFLNKSGQQDRKKWIYLGAVAGVLFSVLAAVLLSTIFNSPMVDTNRELMEGYVGLLAATMMIGVGIWLHSKASISSWNRYIAKQMDQAISKGSVFAMAMISFLSVFREGAETLVFYAAIAPKMQTSTFVLGIVVALAILAIFAFFLFKVSGKIPIHKFFAVATLFIYVLAFKIIGVSMHTLQLVDKIPTTIVDGLPIINLIGFYPTVETISGQAILILVIVGASVYSKKVNRSIKE